MNTPARAPARSAGRRVLRALILLLALSLAGLAAWSWLALSFSYSEGVRAGVVQKFSRKGWLCKTDEGQLAQFIVAGVSPQIWDFSVRDAAVAADLSKAVGKAVRLHYREHRGLPTTCFGDTRYFVDQVELATTAPSVDVAPAAAPPAGAPASSSATSGSPAGAAASTAP